MSTCGSSTFSSPFAVDPEESDYESLYDLHQKVIRREQNGTDVTEEIRSFASGVDDDVDDEVRNEICAFQLQEEAVRKSCEDEILKYIEIEQERGERISEEEGEGSGAQHEEAESEASYGPSPPLVTPEMSHFNRPTKAVPRQRARQSNPPIEIPDLPLEIGDHVYQWRSFIGIPGVFQHHGIVLDAGLDEKGEMELTIADFSCILNQNGRTSPTTIQPNHSVDLLTGSASKEGKKRSFRVHPYGILRVYNSSSTDQKWHKVAYKASVWKTSLWRSGTCTCVQSDPPAKVLARAYFLLENPHLLPSYHIFRSNCECVALWCKTGFWSTLQASSLLSLTAAGQLKSTATLAAYAASQQVTVQTPATGLWGYLGYTTTTQVSLLSTNPHLMPLLAAYGVVTAGGPTLVLWRAQKFWETTTDKLNDEFWKHALRDPDSFAQSMVHWSERHHCFQR